MKEIRNNEIFRYYIYDEYNRLVGEGNSNKKLVIQYVYGTKSHSPDYMIRRGVKYKFIHDQLGSIRLVVHTETGEVVSMQEFDEFGRMMDKYQAGFQSLGFAGGIKGPTGLYRFGARDYDPLTGRWTSKDPILFAGGDTNLYGYVLQDPVNFIDPLGLFLSSPQWAGVIGGAIERPAISNITY